MTGAGHVCFTSSAQESRYTQREPDTPAHHAQPYLGSAVRHRLQSDRPTEQLNRVTETEERRGKSVRKGRHRPSYDTRRTSRGGTRTVQVFGAVDEEGVLPPHIDGGQVFLQRGGVGVLEPKAACCRSRGSRIRSAQKRQQ